MDKNMDEKGKMQVILKMPLNLSSTSSPKNLKNEGRRSNESFKNKENQSGKYLPCGVSKRRSHLGKYFWFKGKSQYQNYKKFDNLEKAC